MPCRIEASPAFRPQRWLWGNPKAGQPRPGVREGCLLTEGKGSSPSAFDLEIDAHALACAACRGHPDPGRQQEIPSCTCVGMLW